VDHPAHFVESRQHTLSVLVFGKRRSRGEEHPDIHSAFSFGKKGGAKPSDHRCLVFVFDFEVRVLLSRRRRRRRRRRSRTGA
jgi:hypothetical protein